ncbi:fcf2 pre-rRNA processing domain-containing protein [Hirsutella rhossiliensis]|uniref:Fcf2 pre-rRNA processing domain-containing protein n=1 Tax=Hirsutella rhossiliensis TaxID=111463 RepID=A0A9P8SFS0_9HYPO|nr:fcf2 pre-rRNA processing domain-containing protein [Hirsutella rhossiliensis]KAH0960349.1 fcf2 pre-rRNA processing domain-containing protein [Hirsutella rhossiliensis]
MPGILDDEVDELLREAEQRLHEIPAFSRPGPPGSMNRITALDQKPNTHQAPLAVRQPQATASRAESKNDTAGPNWFNLPKTVLTPEFKRDWQLLRMRGLLDPKHQKKALPSAPPGYSQIGEVISGPADSYGARLTRREKRRTIFEQVTAAHDGDKLKSKYAGIQRSKTSGKKAFYQRLLSQRRKRQN